jgi:hypothetical protein
MSATPAPQARLRIARHAAKQVPGNAAKEESPEGTAENHIRVAARMRAPALENSRIFDLGDPFPALSFRRAARNLLVGFCIVLCGCGEAERKDPGKSGSLPS